jgi:hypothetical protein
MEKHYTEMEEFDHPLYKTLTKQYQQEIVDAKEHLKEIKKSKPSEIGRYFGGLKGNVGVTVSVDDKSYDRYVYVDAAIAKLNNHQLRLIKTDKLSESETSYCPVYGFKKTDNFCPSGDLKTFLNEFHKHDSELRFAKIGRTTGYTDEGFIDPAFKSIFVKTPAEPLSSAFSSVSLRYCKDCIQSFESGNDEMGEDSKSSTNCAACGEKIGKINVTPVNDDVEDATTENDNVEDATTENYDVDDNVKDNAKYKPVWVMWARNCFLIRKKRTFFGRKGDSGALVFDQKNNYAWGLVFGVFDLPSINSQFCLASPLCAALKALENKTGIKGLKLW